jgi:hypothetical protein
MFLKKTCSHLHKNLLSYELYIMVHFYCFDWSYEIFINLPNPITQLTFSSFKNIKENNLDH